MLLAVLSGFLLAFSAPALVRLFGRHAGWAVALLPGALFLYFAGFLSAVNDGPVRMAWEWLPALGIELSFVVDGLSLLMALLISGIGFFIFAYAGRYLEGHRDLGRFFAILLCFMASMLGLVLADNLIALFVFWELTSITSWLLIGFNHDDAQARRSALQGLIVTAGGGLVLMAGFVVLGQAAGTLSLSEILTMGEALRGHEHYSLLLVLILVGAFTKSAQFPFHFWLPNAMAAPTPVSAYLHSATMVKAGVYLLARLQPALGDTVLWTSALCLAGGITFFTGGLLAVRSTGIKKVLAYSTVMALGMLVMLIGIGTEVALLAAVTGLLAHSLYKGTLFMVAGILDHEVGAKDLRDTGGLRHALPLTALAAGLAALSMAGVLPLLGFVGKELLLEAVLGAPQWSSLLLLLTLAAAVFGVVVALLIGLRPWFGAVGHWPKTPAHEAPPALLAGPLVLALLGVCAGLALPLVADGLLIAAATAVAGRPPQTALALWHGPNLALLLSTGALLAGAGLYRLLDRFRDATGFMGRLQGIGPERGYEKFMEGIVSVSAWQTRLIQNGYLRYYLLVILLSTVALVLGQLWLYRGELTLVTDLSGIRLHEYAIVLTLLAATLMAVRTRYRLAAVAALGVVGFAVSLLYVLFSAPDVAITQVLVETLTVILLVLVLFRLPRYLKLSSKALRLRDVLVALLVGATMSLLVLLAAGSRYYESISAWFVAESVPSGHGRNIVNVILVDFRALDTLGEIFVLALAAIGVYAMLKFRAEDKTR
ncbi:MAG: putative monovalent cation/H+ antiporter subunit A [Moraxellaceae bacterium]|nr:putative monovalent cation/H+ antiporter subunit A [Moraxellaceae bacterium]